MQTSLSHLRYIVVEGATGSGKSAVSRRLAVHLACPLLSENAAGNPFLEPFYQNPAHHGLAVELQFLLQRAQTVRQLADMEAALAISAEGGASCVVGDFLLEKDNIYAPNVLSEAEQTLFWHLKQQILPEWPAPDLVVYLQTSAENDEKRLQKRSESHVNLFPAGYLKQIHEEYQRYFYLYDRAPLLIANADELDFVGNDAHFELLLHTMANMRGSRCYLNLME